MKTGDKTCDVADPLSASKAAPASSAIHFLIGFVLLVRRYICPVYPELRSAEFYHLSVGLLALYVACRKFIGSETRIRWFQQLRLLEKVSRSISTS